MNRSEIVTTLSDLYPKINRKIIDSLVRNMFGVLVDNIAIGRRIEVRGFGCFSLKERSGKIRNPRDGCSIEADSRHVVYFRPGKELKQRVNTTKENN